MATPTLSGSRDRQHREGGHLNALARGGRSREAITGPIGAVLAAQHDERAEGGMARRPAATRAAICQG
jgi:hypothetical protein